jgi:hypothetical protein
LKRRNPGGFAAGVSILDCRQTTGSEVALNAQFE